MGNEKEMEDGKEISDVEINENEIVKTCIKHYQDNFSITKNNIVEIKSLYPFENDINFSRYFSNKQIKREKYFIITNTKTFIETFGSMVLDIGKKFLTLKTKYEDVDIENKRFKIMIFSQIIVKYKLEINTKIFLDLLKVALIREYGERLFTDMIDKWINDLAYLLKLNTYRKREIKSGSITYNEILNSWIVNKIKTITERIKTINEEIDYLEKHGKMDKNILYEIDKNAYTISNITYEKYKEYLKKEIEDLQMLKRNLERHFTEELINDIVNEIDNTDIPIKEILESKLPNELKTNEDLINEIHKALTSKIKKPFGLRFIKIGSGKKTSKIVREKKEKPKLKSKKKMEEQIREKIKSYFS